MITKSFQITQPSTVSIVHGEATVSIVNSTPYDMLFNEGADLTGRFHVMPYSTSTISTIPFDELMTFLTGGNLNSGSTLDPILETCTQELTSDIASLSQVVMVMTWPNLTGFTHQAPILWSADFKIYLDSQLVRAASQSGQITGNESPNFTTPGYTLLTGFPVPENIRFEVVMTFSYRGS